MLYWKLYSQPVATSNIGRWLSTAAIRESLVERLQQLVSGLPQTLGRDAGGIVNRVTGLGHLELPGAASESALPVRSTLLHFLYPSTVPIFDKQVLLAIGVTKKGANKDPETLREYIPFAWRLADCHATGRPGFTETPLRLTDMALWITRGD
jgi:hypothetical protein